MRSSSPTSGYVVAALVVLLCALPASSRGGEAAYDELGRLPNGVGGDLMIPDDVLGDGWIEEVAPLPPVYPAAEIRDPVAGLPDDLVEEEAGDDVPTQRPEFEADHWDTEAESLGDRDDYDEEYNKPADW